MNFYEWADLWGVPYKAIDHLNELIRAEHNDRTTRKTTSDEAYIQSVVRHEMALSGGVFWRNNVGVAVSANGAPVRYGLANDSPQMNKRVKSSDLIGIKPIRITENHVGQTIGQFFAREVKRSDWRYSGTERERAQLKFIELVLSLGGNAAFVTSEGSF